MSCVSKCYYAWVSLRSNQWETAKRNFDIWQHKQDPWKAKWKNDLFGFRKVWLTRVSRIWLLWIQGWSVFRTDGKSHLGKLKLANGARATGVARSQICIRPLWEQSTRRKTLTWKLRNTFTGVLKCSLYMVVKMQAMGGKILSVESDGKIMRDWTVWYALKGKVK